MPFTQDIETLEALMVRVSKEKDDLEDRISTIEDNDGEVPFDMQSRYDTLDELWDCLSDSVKAMKKLQTLIQYT